MREESVPAVYILASKRHGTLYIGVTSDLCSRIADNKQGMIAGFTREYDVKMLVWYEFLGTIEEAIKREKQMKEWKRAWKIDLIEKLNPTWRDLFEEACGAWIE
jgi:putative endonuclease